MSPAGFSSRVAPERHPKMDRLAGRLAALGAGLGLLAGGLDTMIGSSIRPWIGNKLDPTPLGLSTVILSAVALAGAARWHGPSGRVGDRRLATVLAFVIPSGIGFTTVGRLWYLPGVLLLVAGGLVVGASARGDLSHAVNRHHWLSGLTALLGGYYLFLGGDALPEAVGVVGILGALAIWTALLDSRSPLHLRRILLAAGALPFAIVTWWSVVSPLIAVLVLAIGPLAIRPSQGSRRADPGRVPDSAPASAS